MIVKSICLIELDNIISKVEKSVLRFSNNTGIVDRTDITNLFISRVILELVEIYKEFPDKFIVLFISNDSRQHLAKRNDFINFKRFFKIIEKKLQFPFVVSNISFSNFIKLINTDCPEYEELINDYHSFAEIYPALKKVVKQLKFYKIDKEIVGDVKSRIKLLKTL